jgi:hypothetical protein
MVVTVGAGGSSGTGRGFGNPGASQTSLPVWRWYSLLMNSAKLMS